MKPVHHTARSKIAPEERLFHPHPESSYARSPSPEWRGVRAGDEGDFHLLKVIRFLLLLIFLCAACQPVPTSVPTGSVTPPTTSTVTPTARPIYSPTPTGTRAPSPTQRPVSTLSLKDKDLQGVSLQFWYFQSGQAEALLQNRVAEFNSTNRWGITIQAQRQNGPGGMDDQFSAAQANHSLPDIVTGYPEQASHWDAAGGVLVDLVPYIADPVWGLTVDAQQDFYPVIWNQDVISVTVFIQGSSGTKNQLKRIGFPWYRTGFALIYNQTWARELGFSSAPQTPDEFRIQACAAARSNAQDKDRTKAGTGGWLITSDAATLLSWIYAFNGNILLPGDNGYQFSTAEAENALGFLKDLSTSGCAWQTTEQSATDSFATRRALFYTAPLEDFPLQQAAMEGSSNKDSWTAIPFPSVSGSPIFLVYGPSFYMVRSTPEKQLAGWLFAKWMASPDNQARWVEANGELPTRVAATKLVDKHAGLPQWQEALSLLPEARSEPNLPSWSTLRWVLADSQTQLYGPDFTSEKIPDLLKMLDELAAEIVTQAR